MDEKLLALLKKSNLFKSSGEGSDVQVNVNSLKEFRFWLPNFFLFSSDLEDDQKLLFNNRLKGFFVKFLDSWVNFVEFDPKKPFDWPTYSTSVANFFSNFDCDKFFKQLISGKKTTEIPVPPNNSKFLFHRMGDILAFDIEYISSKEKKHVTAIKAIEALCRKNDPCNNQGIYELIHEVKVSFGLPKKPNKTGSEYREIDFSVIADMLKKSLPYIEWNFIPDKLVDSYQKVFQYSEMELVSIIGNYFGLSIHARLFHSLAETENDIMSDNFRNPSQTAIWRQGNVTKNSDTTYLFKRGSDLSLELSLRSSLPTSSFIDVDTSFLAHREQFIIANAGAIFSTVICSMILDSYQKRSITFGN